jgi:hypothetical protein
MRLNADKKLSKSQQSSKGNQSEEQKGGELTAQLQSNRPEHKKTDFFSALANNGKSATQLMALENMANASSGAVNIGNRFATIQAKATDDIAQLMNVEEEEPLQGKFAKSITQLAGIEEEEPLQGKFNGGIAQRAGIEEEEPLQGKFAESITQFAGYNKPNDTGLPDSLKSGVEKLSGYSMDDVRVTYNSDKPAQLSAHAYAQGTDIHVAPGQEKHLPHEAWHVAQQKQGRVEATTQLKESVPINDDVALEKEADVMGAKALEAGLSNEKELQAKSISGKLVAQRADGDEVSAAPVAEEEQVVEVAAENVPAQDPAVLAKINENRGLIEMAKNAQSILGKSGIWKTVGIAPSELGETAIAAGGVSGALTGVAGAATNAIDGTSAENAKKIPGSGVQTDFVDQAAGNLVSAVGAGVSGLFSAVRAANNIYKAAKNKDMVAGTEGARDLLATLQSGFICAQEVLKYISGTVPTSVAAAIPGIGIAVSAANIIINAYNGLKAKSVEAEMLVVSDSYREKLKVLLGQSPEKNSKLFHNEKRGKLGSRVEYLRLNLDVKAQINTIKQSPEAEAEFDKIKGGLGIPAGVTFAEFYDAVQVYELGSKMQEINQKRKVYSGREIAADLVSIAGDIAAFFPADGGITAVALKGTAAAVKGAQSLGKAIQGKARDWDILGGDKTRSSDAKHGEYVSYTRSIYSMLASVGLAGKDDTGITTNDIQKAKPAERMIEAAGASTSVLYKTNYGSDASVQEQINSIVESMKKGR